MFFQSLEPGKNEMRVVHLDRKKGIPKAVRLFAKESFFFLYPLLLSKPLSLFDEPADRQQIPLGMEVRNNKQ